MSKLKALLNRIDHESIACLSVLYSLYFSFLLLFKNRFPMFDTDLCYHQAISRMTLRGGLIKALPQVEDLNWGGGFPEKEFLFHVWTTFAYWLRGDAGVEWAGHLLTIGIITLLFWIVRKCLSPIKAALLVGAMTLSMPYFSMRIMLARPHVLAILCFIFILWGLIQDKKWKVFFGSILFALSYHAFHIPLVVFGLWMVVGIFTKKKLNYDPAIWGVSGLALGIVVNPYFPKSWFFSLELLRLAFQTTTSIEGMDVGGELGPLTLQDVLYNFSPQLIAMIWANYLWWKSKDRFEQRGLKLLVLNMLSALFLMITFRSQRGVEYWFPVVILAIAWAWMSLIVFSRKQKAVLALFFVVPLIFLRNEIKAEPDFALYQATINIREAISKIPKDITGKKVVNTNFGVGEWLLHEREDLRFVDLLDPLLLRKENPEKFEILRQFKLGMIVKPYGVLKKNFNADYVISDLEELSQLLAKDPQFKEIGRADSSIRIFELN